jgi:hypothetical protein
VIDDLRFRLANQAFLQHMQVNAPKGESFTSFEHPFLLEDEIGFKRTAIALGRRALQLQHWPQWCSETGNILQAVKEACKQETSEILLEHRWGTQGGSYKALYRVKTQDEIKGLEDTLFDFFLGGDKDPDSFGPRFDRFAGYLRANRLGCNWDFVAYLSFLLDSRTYFPIRSTRFDGLLRFYKIERAIAGKVTWERYSILLDLAEELKERLSIYGSADAVEIQSYMWVVGSLIKDGKVSDRGALPQFEYDQELGKRVRAAGEKERIGLLGEKYVFDKEVEKLKEAGKDGLAARARIIAVEESGWGFDILSYTPDAKELHIEVKTTTRSPTNDNGFWLSENERQIAEQDDQWVIYRVWNIDTTPSCENLGNIVQEASEEWELVPSTWYAKPKELESK